MKADPTALGPNDTITVKELRERDLEYFQAVGQFMLCFGIAEKSLNAVLANYVEAKLASPKPNESLVIAAIVGGV